MEEVKITLDNTGEAVNTGARKGFAERAIFFILTFLTFSLPVFFIPSVYTPFAFTKSLLVSLAVIISLALFAIARLKDGKLVVPNSILFLAGLGVVLSSFLSALFSGAFHTAFIGRGFETGTVVGTIVCMLLVFLVPTVLRSKERIFYCYLAFFLSFFLLSLFHLLRVLFGPAVFSLGIFTSPSASPIGQWNDLGVFFGLTAVVSLVSLELISLSKAFRVLVLVALILSLFFLAVVNFSLTWIVLGLFSLIFFVYLLSFKKEKGAVDISAEPSMTVSSSDTPDTVSRPIPRASLFVLIVSLVFILGGGLIGNSISAKLGINEIEVRPSWDATYSIAKEALAKSPLLGTGPNRFLNEWLLHKPAGINTTPFWNTDFTFGIGLLPTYLVTTGVLGLMAWLAFLGIFLFLGFRAILSPLEDPVSRYLVASSFLGALFLWIFNVFYVPGSVIIGVTFLFTGLFLAALYEANIIKTKSISFAENPRASFVSVLFLIVLLIGSITLGYMLVERYISAVYFTRGVVAANVEGNIDTAERNVLRAIDFGGNDSYSRFLTSVDLARMNALLSQNSKSVSPETIRTKFEELLGKALSDARAAISFDSQNYANWTNLGTVYEAVVPLKIAGAYENAVSAYDSARGLNPASPALLLTRARLEATKGDNAKAKDFVVQALQMKNNYTEAIFLLSQIQVAEGNLKDAVSSVEAAASLAPNDSGVFFQLGVLRYNTKDYTGAGVALSRALVLNPAYANAKYFLGLSLAQLGKTAEAIRQFSDLKASNPDSKEIDLILKNLKAGKSPFANAAPPIDTAPEKRKKLPVPEKTSAAAPSDSGSAGF